MYTKATILTLSTVALAAPSPQATSLCNPIAIPQNGFDLKAYNPVLKNTSALAITGVSRGAEVLVDGAAVPTNPTPEFIYNSTGLSLCSYPYGCTGGDSPLVFGGPEEGTEGVTLKAGAGCFSDAMSQPLFVAGGDQGEGEGATYDNDWAGWEFCAGRVSGIEWIGDAAPPAGCEKVALQVYNLK